MKLYRPEFAAALELFARVSESIAERGLPRPVLVGGAAVEYYTASAIGTGDFDVCTPIQQELEEELVKFGFVRPSGPGLLTRGWVHPDLHLGFEIVGNSPLDGNVPPERLVLIEGLAGDTSFVIIPVEDLIADRMGQYASGTAPEMRDQAHLLLHLHPEVDMNYLEERIRFETEGDFGTRDVKS